MCDSQLTSLTDILIFNSDIIREYIFHHSTHYKMQAFEKLTWTFQICYPR